MLESRVCAPGEYILHVGIRNSSMFFVQQGELELVNTKHGKVIDELSGTRDDETCQRPSDHKYFLLLQQRGISLENCNFFSVGSLLSPFEQRPFVSSMSSRRLIYKRF